MAKILIADDEELIRKLISDCLTKNGHTVLEAEDGEEAIKIFESEEDIALAMLDIMMPEVDGWQVCRKIRETSGIPVMLVSARSQDFDQIMGFESGADDYVTKPSHFHWRFYREGLNPCYNVVRCKHLKKILLMMKISKSKICYLKRMLTKFILMVKLLS